MLTVLYVKKQVKPRFYKLLTTRGVGRCQPKELCRKIQKGTILDKRKNQFAEKISLSIQNRTKLSKSSNIALQQNGEKGESVQKKLKQLLNEFHQSEKFNLTHKTS